MLRKSTSTAKKKLSTPSFPIDVALIHASYVDTQGNCSMEEEGTLADILPIAQAAYTTGGKVIVTVEKSHYVEYGSLDTRFVQVPGIYIEAIVLVDGATALCRQMVLTTMKHSQVRREFLCPLWIQCQ